MRFAMLVAAFGAACLSMPARAADFLVSFTAAGFNQTYPDFLNVPPPVAPVSFSGKLTLNINGPVSPTTTGLTVYSFNLPYGVQFAYDRTRDTLLLGTYLNPDFSIPSTPNSWFIAIGGAFYGTPFAYNLVQMVDQVGDSPFTYSTRDVAIGIQRIDVTTGGVPEPATWAMMLLGFGAMGAALRRRHIGAGVQRSGYRSL